MGANDEAVRHPDKKLDFSLARHVIDEYPQLGF